MAKKIDSSISKSLDKYIAEIRKYYRIDAVFLFGSHARGTANQDSDIDVAIISPDISNEFIDGFQLMRHSRNIDLRIEPHAIMKKDYETNATPFISEIIRTGIKIA